MFLRHPRQEAGCVGQCEQRHVETVAATDETCALVGSVYVEHAGQHRRLLGHDTHHAPPQTGETHDQVGGEPLLHLQEIPVVHDGVNDLLHIVPLCRVLRHQRVQRFVGSVRRVGRRDVGRVVGIVGGQVGEQPPHQVERLLLGGGGKVGHAAEPVVDIGAAQSLGTDLLVGHSLDDVGTGDEHTGRVLDHKREIGERRGVNRTAGAGTQDDRDLGDDTGGQDIAVEYLTVGGQRVHPLLDTRPAGVVDPNDRRTVLQRQVEHLADFLAVGLSHRPAQHGKVLGKDVHGPAVYLAPAGDDAVAWITPLGQTKVSRPVGDELAQFVERAGVEQIVQPLAGGQFAPRVLAFDTLAAPTQTGLGAFALKALNGSHSHPCLTPGRGAVTAPLLFYSQREQPAQETAHQ